MSCPKCGRPGIRSYGGYCTKVHHDMDKKPQVLVLECAVCSRPVVRSSSKVGSKVFCKRCPKNSGETHPNWKEGRHFNPAGYELQLVHGNYKLTHRHTWETENKACILPSGTGTIHVHHINMVKTDNRPENLVLLSNQVHGRIHRLIDAGKYDRAKCLLLQHCEQQLFFVLHTEHLEYIKNTSLPDILKGT